MTNLADSPILQHALDLTRALPGVQAVALSGSVATGQADAFSDIDLFVYFDPACPDPTARREIYEHHGAETIEWMDLDFEVLRSDSVRLHGRSCGIGLLRLCEARAFLLNLDADPLCDEFLPGGLAISRPLHDPAGVLADLKRSVPAYSTTRAICRMEHLFAQADRAFRVLRWLEKAAHRGDAIQFARYEVEALETWLQILHALNRVWYSEEKRLLEKACGFAVAPPRLRERLDALLMHTGDCASLPGRLAALQCLFADTAHLAAKRYPDQPVPPCLFH